MKIEALHVGMKVRHPNYGPGTVKAVAERTADIRFQDGLRTLAPDTAGIEPDEASAQLSGLTLPLEQLIDRTARTVLEKLGAEKPGATVEQLAARWHDGVMALRPADPSLQSKEVPLEVFFHKIVMMRNCLRVLEQKINGHEKLSEADKVEMQQYLTRCYGSMTTFNLLFKSKSDQFGGAPED